MNRTIRVRNLSFPSGVMGALALIALVVGLPGASSAQEPMLLKYKGRFEALPGTDHMQDVAVISDDYLAVVSSSGVTIVDRREVQAGTATVPVARYTIAENEPSNLDGAPPGDPHYIPKFFHVASYPPYLYVSARFDGLWIFRVEEQNGVPRSISEVGRLMRPREFTEGVAVRGDKLYLTHHSDGVEVLSLKPNPAAPTPIDSIAWGQGDAWGIAPQADDTIWVADGRGGVKQLLLQNDQLSLRTGDSRRRSPGMVFDLAEAGNWIVAAAAGRGVTVYERNTGLQRETFSLPGVCVDIKPISDSRVVVACRSWVHALEVTPAGQIEILASTKLHRRIKSPGSQTEISMHIGAGAAHADGFVYIAGWDHLDAHQLLAQDPQADPDAEITSQRAHFSRVPSTIDFIVSNTGEGLLELKEPNCQPASLDCELASRFVAPNQSTTLSISYDGLEGGIVYEADLLSNDPGDTTLRIVNQTAVSRQVDPGDPAVDFSGTFLERNYRSGEFIEQPGRLSDSQAQGRPVLFAIFGTWCPACMPAVASMTADIALEMPRGADFILVDANEPQALLQHVLEKIYIPLSIYLDSSGSVDKIYRQPLVGLPFGRSYVVDAGGIVTTVSTSYSPSKAIEALEDVLPKRNR